MPFLHTSQDNGGIHFNFLRFWQAHRQMLQISIAGSGVSKHAIENELQGEYEAQRALSPT